jgi:hypothetical protein
VSAQKLYVYSRLRVKSFRICARHQKAEIFITCFVFTKEDEVIARGTVISRFIESGIGRNIYFASDNRLHTCFFTFFIEIHNAKHRAVIRDGYGVVSLLCGCFRYFGDTAGSVKKTVFRVKMKMNERHVFPPLI